MFPFPPVGAGAEGGTEPGPEAGTGAGLGEELGAKHISETTDKPVQFSCSESEKQVAQHGPQQFQQHFFREVSNLVQSFYL